MLQALCIFKLTTETGSTLEMLAFTNQKTYRPNPQMDIQNYFKHLKQHRWCTIDINRLSNFK